MKRRPVVSQADIARAIRAAKQVGAVEVEILPDGKILVRLAQSTAENFSGLEPKPEIVL